MLITAYLDRGVRGTVGKVTGWKRQFCKGRKGWESNLGDASCREALASLDLLNVRERWLLPVRDKGLRIHFWHFQALLSCNSMQLSYMNQADVQYNYVNGYIIQEPVNMGIPNERETSELSDPFWTDLPRQFSADRLELESSKLALEASEQSWQV